MDTALRIGNVRIPNRFALAPMAAVNCTAFRLLCKENGAGLIYTQRFDTGRILDKDKKQLKEFLNIQEEERPIAVQVIGSTARELAEAAKKAEPFADIVDINVGCGEEEFLEQGSGAALLEDSDNLGKIAQSVADVVKIPVTAKIRIGTDSQHISGVAIAQALERAGIAAIAVHGRTIEQKYGGKVNWTIMKQIKEKVSIPVIASGDVKSYEEGLELMKKTGCDMVMMGREAQHRPWVFNPKKQGLGNEGIRKEALRFIELYEQHENRSSSGEVGEHVFWMLRDFRTRTSTKGFLEMNSITEIKKSLNSFS